MPRISVILITNNRKNLLQIMIDSLKAQDFDDYEVILVDNGTTDGSDEVCAKYAKDDPRVTVVTLSEHKGKTPGLRAGLEASCGEYIACVDDDDYCDPTMLSFLSELAKEKDADIAIAGSLFDYDETIAPRFVGDERIFLSRLDGLRQLLKRELYNYGMPSKLIRKSLFEGVVFPQDTFVNDIHFIYKIYEKANCVAVHNKPLYYVCRHGENMTNFQDDPHLLNPAITKEYLEAHHTRLKYLEQNVPEIAKEAKEAFLVYIKNKQKTIIENDLEGFEEALKFIENELDNQSGA